MDCWWQRQQSTAAKKSVVAPYRKQDTVVPITNAVSFESALESLFIASALHCCHLSQTKKPKDIQKSTTVKCTKSAQTIQRKKKNIICK